MKTKLTLTLIIALAAVPAQAQYLQITNPPTRVLISLDPSPSPGVTNYTLWFGTNGPGKYIGTNSIGTNLSIIITGLQAGVTWYVANSAKDTSGFESLWSEPISFSFPPPPQPGVMRPQVFITAQMKTLTATQWCDLGTIAVEPEETNAVYRVKIARTP